MEVTCPACGALLRQIAGVHSDGEPHVHNDSRGAFIHCHKCGIRLDWPLRQAEAQSTAKPPEA